MTDWFGGYENFETISDGVSDVISQMMAGNDLLMPGTSNQSKSLIDAVKNGKLDEKILDENIKKILNVVLKTPKFKGYRHSDHPDLKAHAKISRRAATEGMVLLKNNQGTLPLSTDTKIALFGNGQIETIKGGTGSCDVNAAYTISITKALDENFNLQQDLLSRYTTYVSTLRQLKEYQKDPQNFSNRNLGSRKSHLRTAKLPHQLKKQMLGLLL